MRKSVPPQRVDCVWGSRIAAAAAVAAFLDALQDALRNLRALFVHQATEAKAQARTLTDKVRHCSPLAALASLALSCNLCCALYV
jgi:hypothetical protein